MSSAEVQLQQRFDHGEERPLAPLAQLQRDLEELVASRPDHPPGAEGHQGAGCGVFHVRDPVGAVFHTEPSAGVLFRVRQEFRQLGGAAGDVAGVRQFDGESDFLHDFQQGLPAGLQEGAYVQIPQNRLETAQVTGESAEMSGCRGHVSLTRTGQS